MSTPINVEAIRKRAWHYLEPDVARCGGMNLSQLQQFVAGAYHPTEEQLRQLSNRICRQVPCNDC